MSGFAPLTDTTTGRSSKWDATGSSAHVNLTTLISGENQTLNVLETIPANEYIAGAATTSGSPITIGSVGGAGDFFDELLIRNAGSGGNTGILTITVLDSATTIDALTTTVAEGASATLRLRTKSKNGAWKITITAAVPGGIANAKYAATGLFS